MASYKTWNSSLQVKNVSIMLNIDCKADEFMAFVSTVPRNKC